MFLCVLVLLVLMAVAAGSLSQQQLASFSQQHLETVLFPSSFALKWRKKRDHIRMLYYVRDKPWTDTDTSDEDEAKEQSLVEKEPESNAETVPESVLLDEIEDLEDDLDVEVEEEDEDVVTVEKDGPGGEDDDGSPEPDSVDDIEEIDLDDTDSTSGDVSEGDAVSATSAEEQLNESRGLQALWKDFIHMPSPVDLADLTAEQRLAALRANNTDKDALYRQLVSQFDDPLATGGRRALWLDQEFALNLKGLAVLAVHPHLTQSFGESISKKLARGLKLLSSSQKAASGGPNGLYFLHQLVVKALAASLQAHVIHLNHKVIEKVVDLAEQRHVSKRPITKGLVLNALFDMLQHDANPSVILLNDNLDWLLNNQAASQAVLAEFRKVESRLLFIAVEPSDDIKAGHTLASIGSSVDANKVETPSEEQQAMQQNNSPQPPSSMMSSFFGGPPPPGMSMGTGFGLPLPPPPPGFFAPMTRGFQVVIKNGTVNMIPLPPNAMPPGSMPFNPEVMKKVMEEHQKRFNVSQPQTNMMNGFLSDMPRISFPMFPPDMSDEEVQDFMQDPENQAKIKGMIDSVMQSVMHQLSQQPGPMPTHIEVNVQMIPPPQQAAKNQAKPTSAPPSPSDLAKPQPASGGTRSKRSTDAKKFKDDSSVMSVAGKTVANLFEELLIEAPRDHQLKVLWDRFIEEEVSSRIIRINRRLLQQELRKNNIRYNGDVLFQLDEVLRRQVLSRELVKDAIFAALKLQAGKFSLIATVKKSASTAEEVSKGIEDSPVTEEMVSSAATSKLDSLELSLWALDTAIGGIVKVPTPRLGRPAARSKEEIESLALDKHEKALVGNVISPQDIGVTYDMIGGLEEVKENLRQAITYPLKYPRLYQEGVASEAVKGVLLFGK